MSTGSEYAGYVEADSSREEIPVLDMGPFLDREPGALYDLGKEMRWAFGTIGFLYITNHGVPQELITRVFRENARFHALSDGKKARVLADGKDYGGYMPSGIQRVRSFDPVTGRSGKKEFAKPDVGEAFFMTRKLKLDATSTQWPPELPGFRETLVEYFDALDVLSRRLLPVIAVGLGLPTDFFDTAFEWSSSTLRLSHYPPTPLKKDQFNTAPHCDGDFFTLLAQSEVPGLQIFRRSGEWLPAPARPGDFLVNSGELLRIWSNDCLLSTPHRVINSSGTDRYAIPFFYSPKPDVLVKCMDTCHDADEPPRYQPITVAEYTEWFMKENFSFGAY